MCEHIPFGTTNLLVLIANTLLRVQKIRLGLAREEWPAIGAYGDQASQSFRTEAVVNRLEECPQSI